MLKCINKGGNSLTYNDDHDSIIRLGECLKHVEEIVSSTEINMKFLVNSTFENISNKLESIEGTLLKQDDKLDSLQNKVLTLPCDIHVVDLKNTKDNVENHSKWIKWIVSILLVSGLASGGVLADQLIGNSSANNPPSPVVKKIGPQQKTK